MFSLIYNSNNYFVSSVQSKSISKVLIEGCYNIGPYSFVNCVVEVALGNLENQFHWIWLIIISWRDWRNVSINLGCMTRWDDFTYLVPHIMIRWWWQRLINLTNCAAQDGQVRLQTQSPDRSRLDLIYLMSSVLPDEVEDSVEGWDDSVLLPRTHLALDGWVTRMDRQHTTDAHYGGSNSCGKIIHHRPCSHTPGGPCVQLGQACWGMIKWYQHCFQTALNYLLIAI